MKRLVLIAATAALTAAPLAAQTAQKPAMPLPALTEKIDVHVINVDVVVTDRKGNPVHGLKKEDFQLFENGVPKPLTNFYEIRGSREVTEETAAAAPKTPETKPAPAPAAPEVTDANRRHIIFYIDNLSLAPFNRNRVFSQMKKFVHEVMRPGDEAMVATYNRSMKVRVPFTRDPVQVEQIFDVLAGESGLGVNSRSDSRSVRDQIDNAQSQDEAISIARQYSESIEHDLRQSVESLNALMSTVAGIEGKKALVLTTEGFQMQPGREMYYYIDEIAAQKGWGSSGTILEGMSFNNANLIQSVAKTANANNITMYTIHAGGLAATNDSSSAENAKPVSYSFTSNELSNSTESLELMAEMTGGLASTRTNNFAKAFQDITRDLDSYYSLGYRAGVERVDRQRNLDVRVKNPKLVVRSRQTFVEKSTFAEMSDRVIANLLYRTKSNDLRIVTKTGTPVATDNDLYKVPVEVQIPMDNLTLLQQGETYAGGFTLYVVVANKDNDMSDVAQRQQQLRIPLDDLQKTKGKYYTYAMDLLMEKGLNRISVGVVDDISNVTGFSRDQVIAQELN